MRVLFLLSLFAILALTSCKQDPKETTSATLEQTATTDKTVEADLSKYPQGLQDVFTAHGGLQEWSAMKTITFQLGDEVHTSNLQNRDMLIESENYTIGSEKGNVWIAQDSAAFPPSRARFYHNLMFYFYAMPFLLADDGIIYSDTPDLEMDGVSYPGIKIGYKAAVGDSPDDEYILYYHPETKKMSWLAYTVTYGKDQKSDIFSYIKYADWQVINGLLLPKSLDWYEAENNLPTVSRGAPRVFEKVDVDAAAMDTNFYSMPENGVEVD
jgi:hypothetical protein